MSAVRGIMSLIMYPNFIRISANKKVWILTKYIHSRRTEKVINDYNLKINSILRLLTCLSHVGM